MPPVRWGASLWDPAIPKGLKIITVSADREGLVPSADKEDSGPGDPADPALLQEISGPAGSASSDRDLTDREDQDKAA
jgi:hypothetical protein